MSNLAFGIECSDIERGITHNTLRLFTIKCTLNTDS